MPGFKFKRRFYVEIAIDYIRFRFLDWPKYRQVSRKSGIQSASLINQCLSRIFYLSFPSNANRLSNSLKIVSQPFFELSTKDFKKSNVSLHITLYCLIFQVVASETIEYRTRGSITVLRKILLLYFVLIFLAVTIII